MRTKILFCFIFYLSSLNSNSQTDDIRFRKVSPPGGYSFQAIHSFNQDKYGYMWMGGFDGVIRYNSKEIVRFTSHPDKPNGLPSNTITSIAIDKKNNIWVSTNKGLCLFDHKLQEFKQINYTYENGEQTNNNLFSIQIDGQDNLWIADEHYFGFLDLKDNKLIRITKGINNPPRLIYYDETNRLWLGSLNGSVFLVNPDKKNVVKKIDGPGSMVRTICINNNNIWVGYQMHGARMYDLNGNLKKHYSYTENSENDISSASIRKILRDTRGQIWIGSYYGLFKSVGNELKQYIHDEYDGLPHNSIYDVFEDQQGGLWIGTWSGGVAYIHHSDNKFTNFRHSKVEGAISDNMISSFAELPTGTMYVGTELFGLNKYNPLSSTFEQINIRSTKGVTDIKAMEVDKRGGLWIASAFNGVFYRPNNLKTFTHFPAGPEDGTHVSAPEVYSLCNCDSGMWIGTNLGGLNFYNFNTGKISFVSNKEPFSQILNTNVRTISIDSGKNIWLSTLKGLYKIHLPTRKSTSFSIHSRKNHKTKSQTFYFAKQLSDGKIWIGTGGDGVYIYDNKTDSLSFFDANGLVKGKDVYGIIEGIEDNIWITTNLGLVLYNTSKKTSRRFVLIDGIQGDLFNPNAVFKDSGGNLYFGGTNGFSRLEPKPIQTNIRPPNIFINSITVNNKEIIPVQTGINKFEDIILAPKETSLSFDFSADNFLLPLKNEYAYRLSNYVDEWTTSNNGVANFVNLPADEYIFEVKASNNDGIWNDDPAQIKIVIQQVWYKSIVANIFYSLLFFVILFLIIRFYRERLKLKKALLIEKMEHQQEEQLHEMKLKFFTNISHEFRTPLTLINGPIKQLLNAQNLSNQQHIQLDTVKRNTNRLLQLINQIMDLRKLEKGMGKMDISRIELVHFINERIHNFSEEARSKNISFSFNYTTSSCFIEADEEKLDKIIFNLLSNAFKFTPANGKIEVSLSKENVNTKNFKNQLSFGETHNEEIIEISIEDNGQGIGSDVLPVIFDRFEKGNGKKAKDISTGIGLNLCKDFILLHRGAIVVQSTPGEGTRFTVQLPTKQKAQKILYQSHKKIKNFESWNTSSKPQPQSLNEDKKTRLMVVEDNQDLSDYIVSLLQNYYTIVSAENGERGLDILNTYNVDLVISDVMMPQMDGFELCQKIKSKIETSHIPVILLTALSSSENKTIGLEKGADAYISKPFDEQVLLSQINNLLQQRKRLQESFSQKFMTKQIIDVGTLDNYFLNKINSIIENNIDNEKLTVDFLAKEVGLSRSQLHRKLKQISNQSTSEYITMVKIKKATALLSSKQYNVDEVAFKTGFSSHSYFSKCFKKIHGQSPKDYIKSIS